MRLSDLVTSELLPNAREEASLKHVDLMTKAPTHGMMTINGIVTAAQSGWEVIEIRINSGSCETVLPSAMFSTIKTESSEASMNEKYEVANGNFILGEGQKRRLMMTLGSQVPKGIMFSVSDVHKTLLSMGPMAEAGYECFLAKDGGCMSDIDTCEMVPLARRQLVHPRRLGERCCLDFCRAELVQSRMMTS